MPARQKLNGISLYIILALGAIVAFVSGSGTVFWVATGLLLMVAIHSGAFRPTSGKKH